jgi:hypothetical protein
VDATAARSAWIKQCATPGAPLLATPPSLTPPEALLRRHLRGPDDDGAPDRRLDPPDHVAPRPSPISNCRRDVFPDWKIIGGVCCHRENQAQSPKLCSLFVRGVLDVCHLAKASKTSFRARGAALGLPGEALEGPFFFYGGRRETSMQAVYVVYVLFVNFFGVRHV